MQKIDGGSWWTKALVALTSGPVATVFAVAAVVDVAYAFGKGVAEGVHDAMNKLN